GPSMSAPHVAGAAVVLEQRHPGWSSAQVKSALMTTGAPLQDDVTPLKQGGGRIDLPLADNPLLFTRPTAFSFGLLEPGSKVTRTLTLTDAGGGAGTRRPAPPPPPPPGPLPLPAPVTTPRTPPPPRPARWGE